MVTLTRMQPLQSGNMLKSTEQSRAQVSNAPRPGTTASLNVHAMDGSGVHQPAASRQHPPRGQPLGQHPGLHDARSGMRQSPQQQAESGAAIAAVPGTSCEGESLPPLGAGNAC